MDLILSKREYRNIKRLNRISYNFFSEIGGSYDKGLYRLQRDLEKHSDLNPLLFNLIIYIMIGEGYLGIEGFKINRRKSETGIPKHRYKLFLTEERRSELK